MASAAPDATAPLGWSTSTRDGVASIVCPSCTRTHARDIESKLDEAFWTAQRRARRVLVVDDDPAVCLVVRVALEAEGYEVDQVLSGAEALERIRDGEPPDVVLLDVRLPDADGWAIRDGLTVDGSRPSIVMLSAHPNDGDVTSPLLVKPFDERALLQAIERADQTGVGRA